MELKRAFKDSKSKYYLIFKLAESTNHIFGVNHITTGITDIINALFHELQNLVKDME